MTDGRRPPVRPAGRSGRLNATEARAHATPLLLYAERVARAA